MMGEKKQTTKKSTGHLDGTLQVLTWDFNEYLIETMKPEDRFMIKN